VNYITAPAGFYDGDDRVSAVDTLIAALDADLAASKVQSGTTIFGVCRARRRFSVGANPTRPLSLRPVALGAVHGGNEMD